MSKVAEKKPLTPLRLKWTEKDLDVVVTPEDQDRFVTSVELAMIVKKVFN